MKHWTKYASPVYVEHVTCPKQPDATTAFNALSSIDDVSHVDRASVPVSDMITVGIRTVAVN